MKINVEETVLKNIEGIDIYTEFLDDNIIKLNIVLKTIKNDDYNNKISELYRNYLNKKYNYDNVKILKHHLKAYTNRYKATKIEHDNYYKNDYYFEKLNIVFINGKTLNIDVPIYYKGKKNEAIKTILNGINYNKVVTKLLYDINEVMFDYYNSFDIDNLILFDSNNTFVDVHGKKNIKNSDSLYIFINSNLDDSIVRMIFDDFLNKNLQDIIDLKINQDKMKCFFKNGKSLEISMKLTFAKENFEKISNTFLDNNRKRLIKK